jgi:hypothetical protein
LAGVVTGVIGASFFKMRLSKKKTSTVKAERAINILYNTIIEEFT